MDSQDKTIVMNDDLKNRLYDVGFNLQTLPSVKRPELQAAKEKPLVVKIKNQNKKNAQVEFRQSTILNFFQPNNVNLKLEQIAEDSNVQKNTLSSFRIKTTQTYDFQNTQSNFPQTSRYEYENKTNIFKSNSCLRKEKNISQTDFTSDDLVRTKLLVDKVTGKLDLDQRYQNQNEFKKFFATESKGKLRTDTDVDKYIAMCKKNQTNEDNFVYMTQVIPEDPYDLKIYEYSKIRQEKKKEFYTLSQKGFTLFINGKPQDFISLDQWLNERDCYDEIKKLTFFTKFWKWKTIKMWRKNIISSQTKIIKSQLEQKLFLIHPVLGGTLRMHKNFCCEIQALRFVDLTQQQSTGEVSTLDSFIKSQKLKQESVSKSIKEISDKMKESIYSSFKLCLQILRDIQKSNEEGDKKKDTKVETKVENKQEQNQSDIKLNPQQQAYQQLGFSIDMTYEQRSELRLICLRFLRYSYLIDFISIETLKNIYEESVSELLIQFEEIIKQSQDNKQLSKNKKQNKKDPIFFLNIIPNFVELNQNLFEVEEIKEFIPPPVGLSKIQEFNMLYHVRLMPDKIDEDSEDTDLIDENITYQRAIIPNINQHWLQISPSENDFTQTLMNIIGGGLSCLQSLERYSKHDDMTQFVSVLEDWDDLVCDNWSGPDSNYLDPSIYLTNNDRYKIKIKEIMKIAFADIYTYLQKFDKFLMNYYENSQLNLNIFMDIKLSQPVESYNNSFSILAIQEQKFEEGVPANEDIGMLRIDFSKLKQQISPQPTQIINILKKMLPDLIKTRTTAIKEWINKQFTALKTSQGTINDFVRQQEQLRYCEKNFQKIKNQLTIIEKFELKKEDEQQLIDMVQSMTALQQQMQTVQETSEKQSGQFSKKISQQLIPALMKQTSDLNSQVQNQNFLEIDYGYHRAIKELKELKEKQNLLDIDAEKYSYYQKTLNMELTEFEDLDLLKVDLDYRILIWNSLYEWQILSETWTDTPFDQIEAEEIEKQSEAYSKIVTKLSKKLPNNTALDCLKQMVFEFKDTIPVVIALRNPSLTAQHWKQIKNYIIGQDFDIKDPEFTLQSLFLMNVQQYQKDIIDVSTQATQEALIQSQFQEIEINWQKQTFTLDQYKQEVIQLIKKQIKDMYVISQVDDLYAQMDECLANLNNLLGSKYLQTQRYKVDKLQQEILQAQETIDDWLTCQKHWTYLENIFQNQTQDIKKKLAQETSAFEKVDASYKKQMRTTHAQKFIYKIINTASGVSELFKKHKDTLNYIQKQLENYLEEKRGLQNQQLDSFPRFYFVSNDELLEMLAKTQDIQAINKHIKKCFENINKFDMGSDQKSQMIEGMISGEGEVIQFTKPIQIKNEIEIWLSQVQEYMIENLTKRMKQGKQDYELKERKDWVLDHPGQIVSTVAQIYWSNQTEVYLSNLSDNPNSMYDWQNVNYFQLDSLAELIRGGLSSIQHKIIVSLITLDVHARDIIDQLVELKVVNIQDFNWLQQLRYYWEDNNQTNEVVVKQVNSQIKYGYEYLGATSRLVITNLTDRCWMTITGALNIKLGAAPAGPAGTGKTESTKDLAKSLGQLCVVFNCSDQIEYRMMGRLFTGLVQQGAWTCLDEFNRIDIEVLSVVAQQLLQIRQALLRNDKNFKFMDKEIPLKEQVGVFITMNPGYAGRTELPDNLKVLFRPVSMMIPDYGLIAEIMLFAEGFETAKNLSKKMTQLYKLSSEQLSQQKHYDFGMRAIKSVLVMAGSLKRQNAGLKENIILIRAMKDSNIPKFIKEDLPLFNALIQDLFPDVNMPVIKNEILINQLQQSMKSLNKKIVQDQITKIIELFETFQVRFGVMIVGQTNSGKTTIYECLQHAIIQLSKHEEHKNDKRYQNVQTFILNPKAINMGELYGEINQLSREWIDGLGSHIMRNCAIDESEDWKWIIFDGPVDALWIENMNTVLDDNMMLCLANGQRIKLRNEMRMLFEVQDLAVASPATVSRCGMVYLNSDDLQWEAYLESWIQTTCPKNFQEYFLNLFLSYIDKFLDKIKSSFKQPIQTTNMQLIISMCNLIDCFLNPNFMSLEGLTNEKKMKYYQNVFVFSLIWSLGSTFYEQYQDIYDQFVRKCLTKSDLPHSDNVYGFYLDPADAHFKPWGDIQPQFIYQKDANFFYLMVPTQDTIRYSYLTEILLHNQKMVYLTGPSGTGKSVLLNSLMKLLKTTRQIESINLIFSAQTSSFVTQQTIESRLDKLNKNTLGAMGGKKFVIFIDDINMPAVEEYGAQPPIEFLRLLVDKKGLYDRKEKTWKSIENTSILACSAPHGGGRHELTHRFTRHFNILCMPQPDEKTLFKIFDSILTGFLEIGFPEQIKKLSEMITNSTIIVYQRLLKEQLPIPQKFHYTFNLRDVSKVFQGMLMIKPSTIKEPEYMIRLWIHECSRVFSDRLINEDDKEWFRNLIMELLATQFALLTDKEEIFGQNTIKFSDILRLDQGKEYEEIKDNIKLLNVLENYQEEFIQQSGKNRLIFFQEAIDHILRFLKQPRGNALLIGVGGSGKQSLVRLSSFILQYEIKNIEITKNYDQNSFRDFIKNLKQITGVLGKNVTFIFTDTQIIDESFLEDINSLLNSGEVPNIFDQDEKKKIIDEVRQYNNSIGKSDEPNQIYQTFIERIQNNLHIILCMSPIGNALRVRCRKFPSIVDCCTLDVFNPWPDEALIGVSQQLLGDFQFPSDNYKQLIPLMCKEIHRSVSQTSAQFDQYLKRKVYNTPKSYLDFIKIYQSQFEIKKQELDSSLSRLSNGLSKLDQANSMVAQLKIDLTQLQPQLEKQSELVIQALCKVEEDSKKAKEIETKVQSETEKVSQQANEIKVIADDAKFELDKAMPELNKALQAVENIDKSSLQSMRTFPNPPAVVELVMQCVFILLGKNYSWKNAQSELQDLNTFIKKDILGYDKDNIPDNKINKLKAFIGQNEDLLQPKVVAEKASAAKDLFIWVSAMKSFYEIQKKVFPKKQLVEELQQKMTVANESLQKKQQVLNEVKAKVNKLKKESDKTLQNKADLEKQAEQTKTRLQNAEKLTLLLVEEGKRWVETVANLKEEIKNSIGDVFVASACISYCGPFTGVFRQKMIKDWVYSMNEKELFTSENFSIVKIVGSPVVIREWQQKGLPSDTVSQENAIFCMQGIRWPLMIDPQFQANKWIKNLESANNLKVTTFRDQNFQTDMKNCLNQGIPILIQDVEEIIDPSIDNILNKSLSKIGQRNIIKFADKEIDYDLNFKLYMTSKFPNPAYLPETFIKVNIINFTVTFDGLEDQLLAEVVINEEPHIEQARIDNIINLAGYREKIVECEKLILQLLNESKQETLLDDINLISTLEQSKQTSEEIKVKIQESTELEQKIEEKRNQYRQVSIRGSILFFVIKDLSMIDSMYQYSLQYVKQLFKNAMFQSKASTQIDVRIENLQNSITKMIFNNVSRGIFEQHKLIFSFLIGTSIERNNQQIKEDLWSLFLRGPGVVSQGSMKNPDENIINENQWTFINYLSDNYSEFKDFNQNIVDNLVSWQKYIDSKDFVTTNLPGNFELSQFNQLFILKIFKPDKIMFGLSNYVQKLMGKSYIEFSSYQMKEIYEESNFKTPIIFVLSSGADPTQQVLDFTIQMNMQDRFQSISLGQGQGQAATALIEQAKIQGNWVLLQNCHLAKSFMPKLEILLEEISEGNGQVDNDYRLFLTSMPAKYFPVSILQNGIKLTNEPPRGIKANLLRSLSYLDDQYLDSCVKIAEFNKLILGLSFFHAIVQERRKFGPLGWNIKYEFNESDLQTSKTVLMMLLNEQGNTPWDALNFVTGHINYGGRVTDDWDRRLLMSILKKFYTPSILSDHYRVTSNNPQYYIPSYGKLCTYIQYVSQLPTRDDPEVFGMNENANLIYQLQESERINNIILSIQPRETQGLSGKTNDQIVMELTQNMMQNIPNILIQANGFEELFQVNEIGLIPSLSTVLLQEMARFNNLLVKMRSTCQSLINAIQGIEVMSQELDSMYFSFINNQVPKSWEKVAYPSLKPLASWIKDLQERVNFLEQWLTNGNPNNYWISGFYFPQGFLTGVLQTHARRYKISIDQLNFEFKILDLNKTQVTSKPNDGVYIYGMFLEGASWNRKQKSLVDQKPGEMITQMPIIHFIPTNNYKQQLNDYICPLYKTNVRAGVLSTTGQSTNYILAVDLPCSIDVGSLWILRGVALLTQLND